MSTDYPAKARTPSILNVQALRAIAALLVVALHMGSPQVGIDDLFSSNTRLFSPFINFGQFGVDLFFVISGFIMVATTWRLMGRPNVGIQFFVRRAIRIYPPYWLALAPVVIAHWYLSVKGLHILGGSYSAKTSVLGTYFLLPHPADEYLLLPPAWTLVFEMFFYIMFAALLYFQQRFLVAVLSTWLVLELLMSTTLGTSGNFLFAFLGTPLPIEFIGGAFIGLAYIARKMPFGVAAGISGVALSMALWAVEIAAGDVIYAQFGGSSTYHNNLGRVLFAGLPAMLLVYSAVALEVGNKLRAPQWLVQIGNGSYAIYLWNLAILVALRQVVTRLHLHGLLSHILMSLITLLLIIVFSLIVYRYFERPVTDRLHRLTSVRGRSARAVPSG